VEETIGDKLAAIADDDEAIKLNPNFAKAFYWRGRCKAESSDPQGALEDQDRASALDTKLILPGSPPTEAKLS